MKKIILSAIFALSAVAFMPTSSNAQSKSNNAISSRPKQPTNALVPGREDMSMECHMVGDRQILYTGHTYRCRFGLITTAKFVLLSSEALPRYLIQINW
ncbi:hypothetical protein A0O34_21875 [Chryseobacterium glaciei]|uniref:DUF1496 domain-containing protein n=1 Tax=Chryseobacterium glaciei TaxID=1685010 RepID=A0A172Y1L6_9FLAO|nr:hypothetical protein [Chryseobacterium glaciei]ANF53006.1 hypothetical protein A0O34_21875 [Chryseobacterium glaciei]